MKIIKNVTLRKDHKKHFLKILFVHSVSQGPRAAAHTDSTLEERSIKGVEGEER